jgi:hypothetical protein
MNSYWHYTCGHRAPLIRDDGYVLPGHKVQRDPGTPSPIGAIPWAAYAWFTDLDLPARVPTLDPMRDALGLTMDLLRCDRVEYRFRAIEGARLIHWVDIRRNYPWSQFLEAAPGARPAHWYVSVDPVPVIEAPR